MKIEELINTAKPLAAFPEVVIPSRILIDKKGKFLGYKEEYIKGHTLKEYLLKKYDHENIYFYFNIFSKLFDLISSADKADILFPDIATGNNLIIDKQGLYHIIDYEGIQIRGNGLNQYSSVLSYHVDQRTEFFEYYNHNGRITKEISKLNLLYLFFFIFFNFNILTYLNTAVDEDIDLMSMLNYVFRILNLEDEGFKKKIIDIYSLERDGDYIMSEALNLVNNYDFQYGKYTDGIKRVLVKK